MGKKGTCYLPKLPAKNPNIEPSKSGDDQGPKNCFFGYEKSGERWSHFHIGKRSKEVVVSSDTMDGLNATAEDLANAKVAYVTSVDEELDD